MIKVKDKNVEFHFLLTEQDYEQLCILAEKTGLSKSKILRYLIRGCVLVEAPPVEFSMLIREIRAIGNNLNQTLVIAKANGILNIPDLRKEILDLRELEKEIGKQFEIQRVKS
ncbi:MAG: hypothetical protein NC177_17240 [Ruminococcus flavefaciens]|nr:hypothetical protein [Ruminococcus flavefaciens]